MISSNWLSSNSTSFVAKNETILLWFLEISIEVFNWSLYIDDWNEIIWYMQEMCCGLYVLRIVNYDSLPFVFNYKPIIRKQHQIAFNWVSVTWADISSHLSVLISASLYKVNNFLFCGGKKRKIETIAAAEERARKRERKVLQGVDYNVCSLSCETKPNL